MLGPLNQSEFAIIDQIRSKLRVSTALVTPADYKKLRKLMESVALVRGEAWADANTTLQNQMLSLAYAEPAFNAGMFAAAAPVVLPMQLPPKNMLTAIVNSRPFEGRVLKQWADKLERDDLANITNAIRAGMLARESVEDIVRRVAGSRITGGIDGVTQKARNQVNAVTRTAVSHVTNQARALFLQENAEVILMEQFVATLDSGTTPVCRMNDKHRFQLGEGPMPPLHMLCRSLRVAAMNGDTLVNRPAKPVTEKMLLREYSSRNKLNGITSRSDLPFGSKGNFDAFSRKRIRELVGTVPATESYQTWLSKQASDFQDDVLGKSKGKLFRDGGLTLSKFVDRNGNELTLAQLAGKYESEFRAAGLDPLRF